MEIANIGPEKESDLPQDAQENDAYTFEYVGSRLDDQKELEKLLVKWGLDKSLKAPYFRFNHRFNEINNEPFLVDLFNSPEVRKHLDYVNLPGGTYTKVSSNKLKCEKIDLEMFTKLEDNGVIVAENKAIKMMLEEEVRGIMVGDQLRSCLINEDGENYSIFSEEERKEFLFRVFSHLALGGSMCQYEDKATEYFERTKQLYKSLVNVRKDPKTNQIFVESHAFEIIKVENEYIFPNAKDRENPQNFLYVVVSPSLRQVTLFGHKFVPYW